MVRVRKAEPLPTGRSPAAGRAAPPRPALPGVLAEICTASAWPCRREAAASSPIPGPGPSTADNSRLAAPSSPWSRSARPNATRPARRSGDARRPASATRWASSGRPARRSASARAGKSAQPGSCSTFARRSNASRHRSSAPVGFPSDTLPPRRDPAGARVHEAGALCVRPPDPRSAPWNRSQLSARAGLTTTRGVTKISSSLRLSNTFRVRKAAPTTGI